MSSSSTVRHPVFARVYDRLSAGAEDSGEGEHRAALLAGARGRVIEVGAGNGLNFAHYPATVDEVVAVEPEPYLRGKAEAATRAAAVPVSVVDGVADALPAADGTFDVAVASLLLCSVPQPSTALAELHRVLRPGGELRFYEHVRAHGTTAAALQRGLDGSRLWPALAGGCHLSRDTLAAIADAGFTIERSRRFPFPAGPLGLPHVLGLARRA